MKGVSLVFYHYSNSAAIKNIFDSKQLYLTRLKFCKGQKDFYLTLKMYIKILKNINYDKIEYHSKWYTKDKFKMTCNIKDINSKYLLDENEIFGCCLTSSPVSKKFQKKYGSSNISFNLDAIKRANTGFLFIYNVFYSLKKVDQYVYDLFANLYEEGEAFTRFALDLSEKDMPDNFDNIFTRGFYYLKALYKPRKFRFENETRIFVDLKKIKSQEVESFSGQGYCYTHNILESQYLSHLGVCSDKCILFLDSFRDLSLDYNL